jgi:hypothetical protein
MTVRTQTYEWAVSEGLNGWYSVRYRFTGRGPWQVVATVFGEKRAEIVRDALSEESNERV